MKEPLEGYVGAAPEYKESHSVPGKRLKDHMFRVIKPSNTTGRLSTFMTNYQVILLLEKSVFLD